MSDKHCAQSVVAMLIDDPIGGTVHHPYSAFNQGFAAKELGYSKECNPYPKGRENDWWNIGWCEADDQGLGPSQSTPTGGGGDHSQIVGSWRHDAVRIVDGASQEKSRSSVFV